MANVVLLRSEILLGIKLSKVLSVLKNCLKGILGDFFMMIKICFYSYFTSILA